MSIHLKYLTLMFGLLLAWSYSDALAVNNPNPCPSSASAFGCFEVGLPGSSKFSADKPIAAFTDSESPIKDLVNLIVTFALGILVIIGVITIVIGGYMYMTAGGNASQVGTAKEMIYSALVGIFIAFVSVVLLNSVNKFLGSSAVEPSLAPAGENSAGGGNDHRGGDFGNNGNNINDANQQQIAEWQTKQAPFKATMDRLDAIKQVRALTAQEQLEFGEAKNEFDYLASQISGLQYELK